MAGRGRGRGHGSSLSFNLDLLGVKRSDLTSQQSVLQPPLLYPPLLRAPTPVSNFDESLKKQLEIKREMMVRWRKAAAYLTLEEKKWDIKRYSDRYQLNLQEEDTWTPDWGMFPDELQPAKAKKKKKNIERPNPKAAKTVKPEEVLARAKEKLESTENVHKEASKEKNEEEDEEDEKEEEEGAEEEEIEVSDEEEETDYNLTYFDNGEGYGDEEDEDDEPSYS